MHTIKDKDSMSLHSAVIEADKKKVFLLLQKNTYYKNFEDAFGLSTLDHAFITNNSFILTKLKNTFPNWVFKAEDTIITKAYKTFKNNNPKLIHNRQIFDPNYLFNEKEVAPYFLPGNKYSLTNIKNAVAVKKLDPHKLFVCGNLLQSAAVSRIETMKKFQWLLTEVGVDPNIQACQELNPSSYKNTALHTLIANEDEKDSLALIDLLINSAKKEFNFNLTDSEGKTCLCLAIKVGLTKVAKKLLSLKDKVDVNIPDEEGNTPLHYAFLLGHVSIARELLNGQTNETIKNKDGQTAYELLISSNIEEVRYYLETIWINPDRKIQNSKKTYIQQCMENRILIANEYKDYKAKTTAQKKKSIAFLVAAQTGDLTQLQQNCDNDTLNAGNSKGNTALHLACEHEHAEIISFLLSQPGIDLNKKNNENIKAITRLSQCFLVPTLFKEKLSTNKDLLEAKSESANQCPR